MNYLGQARHALQHAERMAKQGDLAAFERWTNAAERWAAAAERLAGAPAVDSGEEEEALRAELRRRVRRYVDAAQEKRVWEEEAKTHRRERAYARRNNLPEPPPLRPHPCGEDPNLALMSIMIDPEPEDGG